MVIRYWRAEHKDMTVSIVTLPLWQNIFFTNHHPVLGGTHVLHSNFFIYLLYVAIINHVNNCPNTFCFVLVFVHVCFFFLIYLHDDCKTSS